MKAIRCREWGAPDVLRLEEAESPNRKQHQVRLRVRAAGVNLADSLMVGGTYQVKPQFPFTPGLEAAGEIVETGSRSMAWGGAAGARGAAQRRRLCRGDCARRHRGGADQASARGVVTTPSASLTTMRERVRSRSVDCSAMIERPCAARLAACIKSICPPTRPICLPRAVSALT